MKTEDKRLLNYLFVLFFLILLYLAYLVVSPFVNAVLTSFVIAYVFYPVYKFIKKLIKNETFSALLASLLIVLLILIPFIIGVQSVREQAGFFYEDIKVKINTGELVDVSCEAEQKSLLCNVLDIANNLVEDPASREQLEDVIQRFKNFIITKTGDIVWSIPTILINVFVTFFTVYYLFKDGHNLVEKFKRFLPLNKNHQKKIAKKLHEVGHAVVYGSIIVAVIQGMLGAIGFWVVGIPSALLWGILMSLFALIPFVGTAIVWVPACLFLMIYGYLTGDNFMLTKGIGLFLYCFLIVSSVDNVLKPKLIGNRADVHPVLVLLGVLGGIQLFGIVGFVIGPLLLACFITFLDIYEEEKEKGFVG